MVYEKLKKMWIVGTNDHIIFNNLMCLWGDLNIYISSLKVLEQELSASQFFFLSSSQKPLVKFGAN